MTIKKDVFVTDIHDLTGYTKSEIRLFLDAMKQVIIKHARRGESIQLFEGLNIHSDIIPEHDIRLPDGSVVTVPERPKVNVRIGPCFKEAIY